MALLPRPVAGAETEAPTYAVDHRTPHRSDASERFVADLPEESSYFRSIRFRLTAWYSLILIVILISLGMALRVLLVRSVENDSNQNLLAAALQIQTQTWVDTSPQALAMTHANPPVSQLNAPNFNFLIYSGMWVAMVDLTIVVDNSRGGFLGDGTIPDPLNTLSSLSNNIRTLNLGHAEVQTVTVEGKPTRVLMAPFDPFGTGDVSAVVVIGQSAESQQKTVSLLNQVLILVGAVGVILATVTGWLIAGRALAPVGRITRTADQIAYDVNDISLSKRLAVPKAGDELSQLALTFNAMLDRLEEAFSTQRRFVADASHELRTPLTAMRGNVDVLLRQIRAGHEVEPQELRESLNEMQHESERMARLITDLLTLARTDAAGLESLVKPEAVSLDVLAKEAFRTGQSLAGGQLMTLDVRQPVMIDGDGDRIVQVMIILLENAIRHTPVTGSISLKIDVVPLEEEGTSSARIIVTDTGAGIAPEHLPHLFERFYRVEGARTRSQGGTGLGLAIALSIVRGHNGWIDVMSGPGKGTIMTIWIPLPPTGQPERVGESNGSLASRIPRLGRHREQERSDSQ